MDETPVGHHPKIKYLVTLTIIVTILVFTYAQDLFHKMPSDSVLRKRFFRDESALVKLVEMSNRDARVTLIRSSFTYLATDASWPRNDIGFSEDRWNEYRGLFRNLHIDGVTRRTDFPSSVFIDVYGSGGALGSSAKGYVYSREPVEPLVQSLDVMHKALYRENKGHALAFEMLAPDWYMFREEF